MSGEARRVDSASVDIYDVPRQKPRAVDEKRRARADKSEFVFVNHAYEGSANNISDTSYHEPPTTVIREQYWACSRWPFMQRALVIAVGVLLGTVIGLSLWLGLSRKEDPPIAGIFRPQDD